MAGTILISGALDVCLGGPAFRYVAEIVRNILLDSNQQALVSRLYEAINGLEILDLQELESEHIRTIHSGACRAIEGLSTDDKYKREALQMLVAKLRLDPRIADSS